MILEKRVKKIFRNSDYSFDGIIIKNGYGSTLDPNFFYTTGIDKGLFENCSALLFPDGKIDLIVSNLESSIAKDYGYNPIVFKNNKEQLEIIDERLTDSKKIGLNFDGISHKDYEFIKNSLDDKEFEDISGDLIKTRMIKDSEEINLIKKACSIADRVAKKIPDIVSEGMYEYELAAEIDYYLQRYGADKPAFLTISSFGKNTSKPHYTHGNFKIKQGDFVLCDFGACYKRYNSDITRTFVYGRANKKQKQMYNTVLNAQKIGFDNINSNIEGKKVHELVNNFINNTEFKDLFIHSTGHSLGIEVHDGGVGFNSECDEILSENMVLTVEPGIYKPDIGGVRIEDDILIKDNDMELLSKANREFIEI